MKEMIQIMEEMNSKKELESMSKEEMINELVKTFKSKLKSRCYFEIEF